MFEMEALGDCCNQAEMESESVGSDKYLMQGTASLSLQWMD